MITIKITNAHQVIKNEKGHLFSKIASYFVDLEAKVEKEIVEKLQEVFKQNNIEAVISIIRDEEPKGT